MDKPLVSVIIPAYNAERFAEQCYANLADQEYKNIEMIFVNDGSTDGTLQLLQKLGSADPRIIVADKPNGGPASARNAGLDLARGEYIAFIDVDDVIAPEYLSLMMEAIDDADICICRYRKEDKGRIISPPLPNERVYMTGRAAEKYVFDNGTHTVMIVPWCKLFRADYIKQYRFLEGRKCEDEEWSYRVIYSAGRIGFIPNVLYDYKVIEGSDSHTLSFERLYDTALNSYERMMFFKDKEREYYAAAAFSFYDTISSLLYIYRADKEKKEMLNEVYRRDKMPLCDMVIYDPLMSAKIILKCIRSKL